MVLLFQGGRYNRGHARSVLECVAKKIILYPRRNPWRRFLITCMGWMLLGKACRTWLYWPLLLKDALNYIRNYNNSYFHSPKIQIIATDVTKIVEPIPFANWGMEILGPFPQANDKELPNDTSGQLYEVGKSWIRSNYHRIESHRLYMDICDHKIWTSSIYHGVK